MYTKIACVILVAVVITHLIKDVDGCWGSSVPEICNSNLPNIPNMASRDPSIMITNASFYAIKCDLYMIRKYTWYRSEYKITNSCPRMFMCSTQFPIWMEGSHPEPYEGVVNRTGCLKSYEKCCVIRYSLAAVNCGDHMAYCLYGLPHGCHQRYCFDSRKSSQTTLASYGVNTEYTTTTGVLNNPPYNPQAIESEDVSGDRLYKYFEADHMSVRQRDEDITKQSEDFSTQGSVRTTKHSRESGKSSQTTLASNGVNTQYTKTTGVPNNPPYNPEAIESEDVSDDGLYKYYEADQRDEDYKRPTKPAFLDIFRKTVLTGTTNIALKTRGSDARISQQGTVTKDHLPPLHDEVTESNQGTKTEQPISEVNHNEERIINQGQDAGRDDDKLLSAIMFTCMGVMFVTIVALLLVLVKHKRNFYEQMTKPTTMVGQEKIKPVNIQGLGLINMDNSLSVAWDFNRLLNLNSHSSDTTNTDSKTPKLIQNEQYIPCKNIYQALLPVITDRLTAGDEGEHSYETIP